MRAVKSKDTSPELRVRRLLHGVGYRYRVHVADLPGKPDLVFAARQKVVFVHGCFWHGHSCQRGDRIPQTNTNYWRKKINRNKERDAEHRKALAEQGWRALTVWECELGNDEELLERLRSFLGPTRTPN